MAKKKAGTGSRAGGAPAAPGVEISRIDNRNQPAASDHTGVVGDAPAGPRRRRGREKGWSTPAAQARRQECIAQALEYRKQGFTFTRIAEAMGVCPKTACLWVREGLAAIPAESAKALRAHMLAQCEEVMQRLMPQLDDGVPSLDLIDNILKVQAQMLRFFGLDRGMGPAEARKARPSSSRASGQARRCCARQRAREDGVSASIT